MKNKTLKILTITTYVTTLMLSGCGFYDTELINEDAAVTATATPEPTQAATPTLSPMPTVTVTIDESNEGPQIIYDEDDVDAADNLNEYTDDEISVEEANGSPQGIYTEEQVQEAEAAWAAAEE